MFGIDSRWDVREFKLDFQGDIKDNKDLADKDRTGGKDDLDLVFTELAHDFGYSAWQAATIF